MFLVKRLLAIISILLGSVDRKNKPLTNLKEKTILRFFISLCSLRFYINALVKSTPGEMH